MIKVAFVGLGLIGGSMAWALKKADVAYVGGYDQNPHSVSYALTHHIVDAAISDLAQLKSYDVVFLALPLKATLSYLDLDIYAENAVVADICGVKGAVEQYVYSRPRSYRYVGCHPMAGKEVVGIENASPLLFQKASMILTTHQNTNPDALSTVCDLCRAIGFPRILTCTAAYHDEKIAYTSQLAHVVSNAYVKSPAIEGWQGYTGGSFQDMTRIACVNEDVWAELYLYNRASLLAELDCLIEHLTQYKTAVLHNDGDSLRALLKEGREISEQKLLRREGFE